MKTPGVALRLHLVYLAAVLLPALFFAPAFAADALGSAASTRAMSGDWITPNRSVVRIYGCGSALCAKIVHVDPGVGHTTDGQNPDHSKRNRPLCGLVVGTGFEPRSEARAEGGKLYDPESGNTYSGTITLDGSTLKLHGYIGFSLFGRTESWHRAESAPAPCA